MTEHIDMAQFVEAKSDQLGADDLIGSPRTITITRVTGSDGDQPVAIHFEGDNGKPWRPCKTMRRILLAIWGRYAADYIGRSLALYRDDSVTFGGLNVGGIRISHMSHLDKETVVVVMKSKGKKAGIKVQPLKVEQRQADTPPEDPRAKAEDWCNRFLQQLGTEDDAALFAKSERILAKLRAEHPDLADAIESKRPQEEGAE